jgi:hypothetical protein
MRAYDRFSMSLLRFVLRRLVAFVEHLEGPAAARAEEEMFDEGFSENNWKKIARYVNERKDYMKEKIKGFARTN